VNSPTTRLTSSNRGVEFARAALSRNGTVSEPDPVAGLAANFSSTPRSAPPPFGKLIAGTATGPVIGPLSAP
jgi:hypothetical protein